MTKKVINIFLFMILIFYSLSLFVASFPDELLPQPLSVYKKEFRNILLLVNIVPGAELVGSEKEIDTYKKYVCYKIYGIYDDKPHSRLIFSTDRDCRPPLVYFNDIPVYLFTIKLYKFIENDSTKESSFNSVFLSKTADFFCENSRRLNFTEPNKVIITSYVEFSNYKTGETYSESDDIHLYDCRKDISLSKKDLIELGVRNGQ